VVGSGVVLEVVGSGVVLDVVGSGVVLEVAGVAYWPAGHVLGAGVVVDVVSAGVVLVLVGGVVDEVVGGGEHVNCCPLPYVKTVGPKLHSQFQSPGDASGPVEYSGHGRQKYFEFLPSQ